MPSIALCLSGGGFRASLFHAGALRRIAELGVLARITSVSSVSGGSITNGVLATRWNAVAAGGCSPGALLEHVIKPLEAFCAVDLRTRVLLFQRANPWNAVKLMRRNYTTANLLEEYYAKHLGLGVKLGDLAGGAGVPSFVFCATNIETGVSWIFTREKMGDYVYGHAAPGDTTVATAVAASSAFPPGFPPLVVETHGRPFSGGKKPPPAQWLDAIPLTDGGVYDNLGLEPVWKSHDVVLVSDAGHPFGFTNDPGFGLAERLLRCSEINLNQSAALRKRWLIDQFQGFSKTKKKRDGTLWAIGGDFAEYQLPGGTGYPTEIVALAREVRTDLDAFSPGEIAVLENHGYAMADVALRKWTPGIVANLAAPFAWPYPDYAPPAGVERAKQALAASAERGILGDVLSVMRKEILG